MSEPTVLPASEFVTSDREIIEFLRREGSVTIAELVRFSGVTATAVRQRLARLMDQGLVLRETEKAGRGRPTHRYSLTDAGIRTSGTNYEDLAGVLWGEIRAVKDPDIRHGLLKRIVARLADQYRSRIQSGSLAERMQSIVALMGERQVPFEVSQKPNTQLPVLTALACPYPSLAEQDRTVCSMEKMLFSEVLGEGVRLSSCRLDGAQHCTFDTSSNPALQSRMREY